MTLVEVLFAQMVLVVGLLALLTMLAAAAVNVAGGGTQSKATGYAREQVEQLRSRPFEAILAPPFSSGNDVPEQSVTRSWTVTVVPGTVAPNRLARITVTVLVNQAPATLGTRNAIMETMRSECGGTNLLQC